MENYVGRREGLVDKASAINLVRADKFSKTQVEETFLLSASIAVWRMYGLQLASQFLILVAVSRESCCREKVAQSSPCINVHRLYKLKTPDLTFSYLIPKAG